LRLIYDEQLSSFAFKFILYQYTEALRERVAVAEKRAADAEEATAAARAAAVAAVTEGGEAVRERIAVAEKRAAEAEAAAAAAVGLDSYPPPSLCVSVLYQLVPRLNCLLLLYLILPVLFGPFGLRPKVENVFW